MSDFKDVLRYLRNRRGLSQAEMAKEIGIGKSTISMYELGNREPDFETLEILADYFNVDMNFLLGMSEEERSGYYLNPETAQIAQDLHDNPELRVLFDAGRNAEPSDLLMASELLKRLKETNPDG